MQNSSRENCLRQCYSIEDTKGTITHMVFANSINEKASRYFDVNIYFFYSILLY